MSKRTFREKSNRSEPQYPNRRRYLALGAAAAISGLAGCGGFGETAGVPVPPEIVDAGPMGVESGGIAPPPDAGAPDASQDAGPESPDGVAEQPDGGE